MFDLIRLDRLIELWFDEDVAHYDLTAQIMVAPDATARFVMNAREELVLAGLPVAERVFRRLDPSVAFTPAAADGDRLGAGAVLATVEGRAQALLTAERIALNIVQRLSGVATETARYVAEVAHTKAQVVDTRKTTPGLRMLEKYAVTCGGARNHRLALDNGIMLKDNHIAVAGSIAAAVARAKERAPILTRIEVECDRLDQVREALEAGADVIMLDNMDAPTMREAVAMVGGRVPLECSGGVRLDTIREKAETGVDFISVGRMTQSAPCVDIGLDEA
jgi:nicotinate-nucleotide pyrophosphorylase (carboxylating)